MRCLVFFSFVLLALSSVVAKDVTSGSSEDGIFHYVLEHSLSSHTGEEIWTQRGTFTLSYADISRSSGGLKFTGEHALHSLQLTAFQNLMSKDGYYRIRLRREGSDDNWIGAAISACALASSSFRELYEFHSDPYGNLVAVSYTTPTSICREDIRHQQLTGKSVNIVSKGTISFGRAGERPKNIRPSSGLPGQPQQVGQQGEGSTEGGEGEKKDDRGFFQKYWIYIVPLVLFMMISAASPPEGPAAGGAK